MMKIHRQALLAYPASQVFDIVNDVAKYPEFLRWCVDSHVLEQNQNAMLAGLTVSIAGFRQKFTTRNLTSQSTNDKGQSVYRLDMLLQDGPFQELQGFWEVTALADTASRIELHLQFEFSAGLVQAAFSKGFGSVAGHLVEDFVNRAHQLLAHRRIGVD